eukprot:Ihof_evm2s370 gene=Ihof_evmTU2s370
MDALTAARQGNTGILYALLKTSAAEDYIDRATGNTVGHEAVLGGHVDCLLLALRYGLPVDYQNLAGETMIYIAMQVGDDRAVTHLVAAGCDVNLPAYSGLSPLMVATRHGNLNCLVNFLRKQCICEGFCHCNCTIDVWRREPESGLTAIDLARHYGREDCWNFLCSYMDENQSREEMADVLRQEEVDDLCDLMGLDQSQADIHRNAVDLLTDDLARACNATHITRYAGATAKFLLQQANLKLVFTTSSQLMVQDWKEEIQMIILYTVSGLQMGTIQIFILAMEQHTPPPTTTTSNEHNHTSSTTITNNNNSNPPPPPSGAQPQQPAHVPFPSIGVFGVPVPPVRVGVVVNGPHTTGSDVGEAVNYATGMIRQLFTTPFTATQPNPAPQPTATTTTTSFSHAPPQPNPAPRPATTTTTTSFSNAPLQPAMAPPPAPLQTTHVPMGGLGHPFPPGPMPFPEDTCLSNNFPSSITGLVTEPVLLQSAVYSMLLHTHTAHIDTKDLHQQASLAQSIAMEGAHEGHTLDLATTKASLRHIAQSMVTAAARLRDQANTVHAEAQRLLELCQEPQLSPSVPQLIPNVTNQNTTNRQPNLGRSHYSTMSIRALKQLLTTMGVGYGDCLTKEELLDRLMEQFPTPPASSSPPHPPVNSSSATASSSSSPAPSLVNYGSDLSASRRFLYTGMPICALKQILASMGVAYGDCLTKEELVDRIMEQPPYNTPTLPRIIPSRVPTTAPSSNTQEQNTSTTTTSTPSCYISPRGVMHITGVDLSQFPYREEEHAGIARIAQLRREQGVPPDLPPLGNFNPFNPFNIPGYPFPGATAPPNTTTTSSNSTNQRPSTTPGGGVTTEQGRENGSNEANGNISGSDQGTSFSQQNSNGVSGTEPHSHTHTHTRTYNSNDNNNNTNNNNGFENNNYDHSHLHHQHVLGSLPPNLNHEQIHQYAMQQAMRRHHAMLGQPGPQPGTHEEARQPFTNEQTAHDQLHEQAVRNVHMVTQQTFNIMGGLSPVPIGRDPMTISTTVMTGDTSMPLMEERVSNYMTPDGTIHQHRLRTVGDVRQHVRESVDATGFVQRSETVNGVLNSLAFNAMWGDLPSRLRVFIPRDTTPQPMPTEQINAMTRLVQDEALISELKKNNHDNCSICYDDFVVGGGDLYRLSCGHVYHVDCVTPWLKRSSTCPLC